MFIWLGASKKDKKDEAKASDAVTAGNKDGNNIGLFPPKGEDYFHQIQAPKIITNLVTI